MGLFNRGERQHTDVHVNGATPEPEEVREPTQTQEDAPAVEPAPAENSSAAKVVASPKQAEAPPAPPEPEEELRITASEAVAPKRSPLLTKQPDAGRRNRHAKVYAFANQKGGVAKTTTTLNLAVAFAESGYRVLAVDLDPQSNLTIDRKSVV